MQISSQQRHSTAPTQSPSAASAAQAPSISAQRVATQGAPPTEAGPASEVKRPPSADQTASNLARLDDFMDSALSRLEEAVKNAPEGEVTSFREAAEALESGLSRLRDGLQNGTLQPEDVQRGVTNSFQIARDVLDSARQGAEGDSAAPIAPAEAGNASAAPGAVLPDNPGEVARNRFQGVTDSVLARVDNLDVSDDLKDAVGEAASAFESATARLDQALFNPVTGDSIDRGTFQDLYNDALSTLQSQLTDLIGGGESAETGSSSILYNAQKGVEGITQRSFGLDLAG